jgi:hypothetical protein
MFGKFRVSACVALSGLLLATPTWCVAQWITSGPNIYYNSGNVGIGTTTPQGKVDINAGANSDILLGQDASNGNYNILSFNGTLADALNIGIGGGGTGDNNLYLNTPSGGSVYFRVNGALGANGAMVVLSSGNVGIGTAKPTAPLNVAYGNISAGSQIYNAVNVQPAGGAAYGSNGSSILLNSVTNHGINPVAGLWSSLDTGGDGGVDYGGSLVFGSTPQGSSAPIERMRINYLGNVGIGTTSPGATLEVNGTLRFSGDATGTVQTTAWTGVLCGGDYAESVGVSGKRAQYEPGDVLIIDPDNSDSFAKSVHPYSTVVAGIYSTKPGVIGRKSNDPEKLKTEIPMAMIGIVPTKVSAENGPIKRGDLLVTSATVGYAMKGTDRLQMIGAIVGKALGSLPSGTGVIEVLVSLQ